MAASDPRSKATSPRVDETPARVCQSSNRSSSWLPGGATNTAMAVGAPRTPDPIATHIADDGLPECIDGPDCLCLTAAASSPPAMASNTTARPMCLHPGPRHTPVSRRPIACQAQPQSESLITPTGTASATAAPPSATAATATPIHAHTDRTAAMTTHG